MSKSWRGFWMRPKVRRILPLSVAIVVTLATSTASWWLYRTSASYQQRADAHARQAAHHEASRSTTRTVASKVEARKSDYHSRMNAKWEYAAYHPWLAVEPDPPEPD